MWELTLPRSAGGRGRGFAFVGFTCKAHAERGIKLVNGQALAGRPVAVDWAVSKAQFDDAKAAAGAAAAEAAAAAGGGAQAQPALDSDLEASSDEEGEQVGGRLVQPGWLAHAASIVSARLGWQPSDPCSSCRAGAPRL